MTETEFDNGYWYALEVKTFAGEIGIPSASKLRKDELEQLIKLFLRTGEVKGPTLRRLVKQYVKLNQTEGSFPQAPSGRYINFISDFLTEEDNATRDDAINAWRELKKLDIPKEYRAWKKRAGA